jgi:hypothetical protein
MRSNVHFVAMQSEISRVQLEIKQLLVEYMYIINGQSTLEERKKIRMQIKMLTARARELQSEF